jgi:hypothetical protein
MPNLQGNCFKCHCAGVKSCNHGNLTFGQRVKLLQLAYSYTRRGKKAVWIAPNTKILVPGDGFRGPISASGGSGYQLPLPYSGVDGWGATLAPSTMDFATGYGVNVGVSGHSASEGYCNAAKCQSWANSTTYKAGVSMEPSKCGQCLQGNLAPSKYVDPVLGEVIHSKYEYTNGISNKFGKTANYCDGCIKNSQNDPSFINHDDPLRDTTGPTLNS